MIYVFTYVYGWIQFAMFMWVLVPFFFNFLFYIEVLVDYWSIGFPGGANGKEPACQCRRNGFYLWVEKIPWRRQWQPTPVSLPGESHGQRSLESYSPWDSTESDTTEAT